jgi:hypothetical protein
MKDPILYYKEDFERELRSVQYAATKTEDRISIVSLLQDKHASGLIDEKARVFKTLPSQPLFLFLYFFTSLIDQAIHSGLRDEHPYFDRLAGYPKFVGILATYWHNLHPGLLLLTATLYTRKEDQDMATKQYYALSDFFTEDYEDFILNIYPSLTGRLQTEQARRAAVKKLYSELSNAVALLFIPKSLGPYSLLSPDNNLYRKWISYFGNKINAKLNDY